MTTLQNSIKQVEKVGISAFLISLGVMGYVVTFSSLLLALGVGSGVLALLSIVVSYWRRSIFRRIKKNIVPSVILLTSGDIAAYDRVENGMNNPKGTLMSIFTSFVFAIAVNIFASYVLASLVRL